MESEFDKEIDVLLRQAMRRGEAVSEIAGSHLDADEINAFAEQMLPGKAGIRAAEHLADCSRCRSILANLTLFNAETESEIVHALEKKLVAASPARAWYKKLFAFPQLAYAMGILALIFGGIIAVIVLQNPARNSSSEVARMNEDKQLPSPLSTVSTSANANISQIGAANSSMSNNLLAANVAADSSKTENKNNSAQTNSGASTTDKKVASATPASKPQLLNEAEESEKSRLASPAVPPAPAKNNDDNLNAATDAVTVNRQAETPQNYGSQNQMRQSQATPGARSVQNFPAGGSSPNVLRKAERRAEMTAAGKDKSDESGESRSVNGKNFRRAEGIWYDVDYKSQKTINLRRGSEDYKKLAANLRSIAERLGGVVVIVSGGTAYRIQ